MSRYFNWPVSLKRFVRFDTARAEDVNASLDQLTAGLDVLDQDVNRALKLPFGTADQTIAMSPGQRANLTLGFDIAGNVQAFPNGRYKGDWTTATLYLKNEVFRDAITKNLYTVLEPHTSGVLANDITTGRVQLVIDVVEVEFFKNAAAASAAAALVTRNETTAIKNDAIAQTTAIKDDAVAQTNAIKAAAIADTNAIKAAAIADTNAIKADTNAIKIETTAIKDAALTFRNEASVSAQAAQASANYRGVWATLTGPISSGTVFHIGKFWLLVEALADITLAEPGTSDAWAQISLSIPRIPYEDRATLRATNPENGDQAVVAGLGLFVYAAGSDEPDDDESCFATATGRWLLQAASWDLVDAWQLPEVEERDAYDEDEPLRFAASFAAKVITGSATCAITSVTNVSSASFTGTITGAAVGDRVIATPPAALGATAAETGRLGYHAFVSAANTVTVMLTNASAAAANTNAAIRAAWPITVIKS